MEAARELEPIVRTLTARVDKLGLRPLSEPERTVYLIWNFTHALDNGGVDAFFYNKSGEHAEKTVEALYVIGAKQLAKLLEESIALFPDGDVPSDIDERTDVLEEIARDTEDVFERLRISYDDQTSERILRATFKYWMAQTAS
ncbi:MAG: DUF4375 domain-containing protein [Planctomycetes bacterium]|nr:DUF4375 domain-containing protein [Planctomycetota bacterium]